MNQLIEQIADDVINNMPRHVYIDIPDEFLEPFTQAIVRECIRMADEFELNVNQSGLVDRIKTHFGIES
jgi:hypothetical protein